MIFMKREEFKRSKNLVTEASDFELTPRHEETVDPLSDPIFR
jgi:hypothetical protein